MKLPKYFKYKGKCIGKLISCKFTKKEWIVTIKLNKSGLELYKASKHEI